MNVTLFGHPFLSIGLSELLVGLSEALSSCYFEHSIFNISHLGSDDQRPWLKRKVTTNFNDCDVRIFCINGDEIENTLQALLQKGMVLDKAYNIIVPAWELSEYPEDWRHGFKKFDEVWAMSRFVASMFSPWYSGKVRYLGQPCERRYGAAYTRKDFGINESSFVFLGFFDESSYFARKNPYALEELFRRLDDANPLVDFQFVLKHKNMDAPSSFVTEPHPKLVSLGRALNYDETTSLIRSCDTFVSLHRSEGFGRGGAEALLMGKYVVLTAYSGCEDYLQSERAMSIGYQLIACEEGSYPYCEGQQWANPNMDEAFEIADKMLKSFHSYGHKPFRKNYLDQVYDAASNLSVGSRMLQYFDDIYQTSHH